MTQHNLGRISHWLLLTVAALMIISGYGVTQYQVVEKMTFGFLSKSLAFKMHSLLGNFFIVLLAAHICLIYRRRRKRSRRSSSQI